MGVRWLTCLIAAAVTTAGCSIGWTFGVENESGHDVIVRVDGRGLHRTVRAAGGDGDYVIQVGSGSSPFEATIRVFDPTTCQELTVTG